MEPTDRNASWVTSSARLARSGGSATVVSLEGVRTGLGERWPKLRENVAATLDDLVRRDLGPADLVVPLDEMNRLVIMPKAAAEEGAIACLRIAYDLNVALLGACRADQLTVARALAVGDTIIEIDAFGRDELFALAAEAGLQLAPDGDERSAGAEPGPIRIEYLPVWDGDFEVIRAYRCQPADSWRQHGPEPSAQRLRAVSGMTLALIEQGARDLKRHLVRGERFALIVPVSFEILQSPAAREAFLAAVRACDSELRPYLTYEMKDLQPGIPQSRVAEVVTILQAFCGSVVARAPRPLAPFLSAFRNAGVKALGVSLKGLTPAQWQIDVAALASETRRSAMTAYAHHVDSPAALGYCLDRGVKWLCGSAVAAPVAEPGPLTRLPRAQLLKSPAAA